MTAIECVGATRHKTLEPFADKYGTLEPFADIYGAQPTGRDATLAAMPRYSTFHIARGITPRSAPELAAAVHDYKCNITRNCKSINMHASILIDKAMHAIDRYPC